MTVLQLRGPMAFCVPQWCLLMLASTTRASCCTRIITLYDTRKWIQACAGLKGGKLKYHSSKLEFLALKWAVTEQFREYLQYQPFLVRTNNNPLTYVMTTPNLDAVGHRWVAAMAGYNFEIEYVCGTDNKVADALSRIGERVDEEAVKELLDQGAIKELLNHAVHYGVPSAEADDPRVVEEHEKVEGEIIIQARMLTETKRNYQNLADSQWVVAQRGDQAI